MTVSARRLIGAVEVLDSDPALVMKPTLYGAGVKTDSPAVGCGAISSGRLCALLQLVAHREGGDIRPRISAENSAE